MDLFQTLKARLSIGKRGQTPHQLLYLMFYCDGPFPQNVPWLLHSKEGTLYRVPFRYSIDLVEPTLRDKTPSSLIGRKALIVMKFKKFEPSSSVSSGATPPNQVHIPLRRAEIVQAKRFGDFLFLYFRVGSLVDFRNTANIDHFSAQVQTAVGTVGANILMVDRVEPTPTVPQVSADDLHAYSEAWLRLVDLVTSASYPGMDWYQWTIFLKADIHRLDAKQELRPQAFHKSADDPDRFGYKLFVGSSYTLRLVQLFRPRTSHVDAAFDHCALVLLVPQETIVPLKDRNAIIGPYDEHNFVFQVRRAGSSGTITVLPSDNPAPTITTSGQTKPAFIPDLTFRFVSVISPRYIALSYVLPVLVFLTGTVMNALAVSNEQMLSPEILARQIIHLTGWTFLLSLHGLLRIALLVFGVLFQGLGLYVFKRGE